MAPGARHRARRGRRMPIVALVAVVVAAGVVLGVDRPWAP